jgi:O-antigen biosynthesis protein
MTKTRARVLKQGLWTLRTAGLRTVVRKAARLVYLRLGGGLTELAIHPDDIADSTMLVLPMPTKRPLRNSRLTIGWICTPPALGSGGHTTMFRMIRALEDAGHTCIVYLYDRHGGELSVHTSIIREGWPQVHAEIRDVGSGLAGLDACFATSWESAHVLATRGRTPMRRLYFVQDYEPYFYPRGSEYAFAEDSYRLGFRCIALGDMVANCLVKEIGIHPDVTQFGCDTAIYRVDPASHLAPRSGVVFYARPGNPRRGYWLARLALRDFHRSHPEVPIYVYGADVKDLPFDAKVYPRLTPMELNSLYNRCVAGLALSFTNISLVAEELLAAGAIPVVNDSPEARADLQNPYVAWARSSPAGITEALAAVVTTSGIEARANAASRSVRDGWGRAERDVVRIVDEEVYGSQ